MRWLVMGLLLAACVAPSAQQPAPPEQVSIPGPEGVTLRALLVRPTATPVRPTIIALHGCAGMAPASRPLTLPVREADWAARLAALGHPLLFPDSFGSRDVGPSCGRSDFPVSAAGLRRQDAHAAARWAAAQPWAGPGGAILMGWSDGGSTMLAAVQNPPPGLLRGAVGFYPGCGNTFRAGASWSPGVPMLLLLGERDNWTAARFCQGLATAHPSLITAHTYPGAWHDFDHPSLPLQSRTLPDGRNVSLGTDAAARSDALRRVPEWLAALSGG